MRFERIWEGELDVRLRSRFVLYPVSDRATHDQLEGEETDRLR